MTNEFNQRSPLDSELHREELQGMTTAPELEAVWAQAIDLDLTWLPPVAGELSRYPEGIYEVDQIIDSFVPAGDSPIEEKADSQRVFTALWVLPNVELLKDRKCYVSAKSLAVQDAQSPLVRAHTILDRIAELTAESSDLLTLNAVVRHIRQEAVLLQPDADTTDVIVEDIVRRHPRLRTEPLHTLSVPSPAGQPPDEEIFRVTGRDYIHLPATIGAAIERLAVTTSPKPFTPAGWLRRIIPKSIQLTEVAKEAFMTALAHDPRFEAIRVSYGRSSSTKKYRLLSAVDIRNASISASEPRTWQPIKSLEELQSRPVQELARRALDLCGTYDLQESCSLADRIVSGIAVANEHDQAAIEARKKEVIEALLYDPRVQMVRHRPEFLTIARTPNDSKRFAMLTYLMAATIRNLCVAGAVVEVSRDALYDTVIQRAEERAIQLTAHDRKLLGRLSHVNKCVKLISLADGTPGYRLLDKQTEIALADAQPKPVRKRIRNRIVHDDTSPDTPSSPAETDVGIAEVAEDTGVAEAHLTMQQKRLNLCETFGQAITAELDAAILKFVDRYIDDNTATVNLQYALTRLEGMLPGESFSPATQEYLVLALATNDIFEFDPERPDRLGVVRSAPAERETSLKGQLLQLNDMPQKRSLPGSTVNHRQHRRLPNLSMPPQSED